MFVYSEHVEVGHADVGSLIRRCRIAAGLSLRETARQVSISPATLSAIETGKTGVSIPRLHALATALGATVAQLIGEQPLPEALPVDRRIGEPASGGRWREFPPLDIDPALRAAIDSFVETGYHGATMREIAHRAGMSVPGIYHYYRDKQQLLVRAFELTMDELDWRVTAARSLGATGIERVALAVESLALFHTHRHKLAFIGASEMRSLEPANRAAITASSNRIQYLLDADIDAAVADGSVHPANARIAGRAIATMCTALPQWFRTDGTVTPEEVAVQYAEFALHILGNVPPTPSRKETT